MNIWDLNCEDNCDVQIFLPPSPTFTLVDVGTRLVPVSVTSAVAAPIYTRQRSWVVGGGGPVTPALPSSTIDSTQVQEWYISGTDDTNTISLESVSGLQLSGPWVGGSGSILYLQADGAGGWIEGGRNEI